MLRSKLLIAICLPLLSWGQLTDQLISQRLAAIESTVPLSFNSYVRAHVNDFVRNDKSYTSKALSKFKQEESNIKEIIASYNLPEELSILALSLSGCSNFEQSEEGGTGIFLMRYPVAKSRGLHISSYVDERRDIEKSTHAFSKEMKELYVWLIQFLRAEIKN